MNRLGAAWQVAIPDDRAARALKRLIVINSVSLSEQAATVIPMVWQREGDALAQRDRRLRGVACVPGGGSFEKVGQY
jgi:hypothetical protein